jgi:hypothetical protein
MKVVDTATISCTIDGINLMNEAFNLANGVGNNNIGDDNDDGRASKTTRTTFGSHKEQCHHGLIP